MKRVKINPKLDFSHRGLSMRLHGLVCALAGCTFAIMCTASAADLPAKAPAYKAPAVIPFSWTGFYVGGNAGYGWSDADLAWTHISGFDALAAIAERESLSNRTLHMNGFVGGGQAGYNWQMNSLVLGVEVDANYVHASTSSTVPLSAAFPGNSVTQGAEIDSLFTARGRIGWAWDRVLVYATGGWAGANAKFDDSSQYPGSSQAVSISKFMSGWTVGGGLEYALTRNWSVKAEYLYADFGNVQSTSCNNVFPTLCYSHDHKLTTNIARLGVNYRF